MDVRTGRSSSRCGVSWERVEVCCGRGGPAVCEREARVLDERGDGNHRESLLCSSRALARAAEPVQPDRGEEQERERRREQQGEVNPSLGLDRLYTANIESLE